MIEIINLIRNFMFYVLNRLRIGIYNAYDYERNDLLLKCSNTLVVNLYIPIIICSIIVQVENYKL